MVNQCLPGSRQKGTGGIRRFPPVPVLFVMAWMGSQACAPVQREPDPLPPPSPAVVPEARPSGARGGENPPDDPPSTACGVTTGQEIVDAVNAVRAGQGQRPLVPDLRLIAAAQAHSRDMASRDQLGHQGGDGTEVQDRAVARGYTWLVIAENVASGQPTVGTVMDSWLGSAGHRRNILNPDAVHLGVALDRSASGRTYWTQVFGAPDGPASLPDGGCHP